MLPCVRGEGYATSVEDSKTAHVNDTQLAALLDEMAPFGPAPMCPEIGIFFATDPHALWRAVADLAGQEVGVPYWALPWPGGLCLARFVLDQPDLVRGRGVIDVGTGGGVAAIAAMKAGARRVIGVDLDPWALRVTLLAAARNGVSVEVSLADFSSGSIGGPDDLVLNADLEYSPEGAAARRRTDELTLAGASLLLADGGRTHFVPNGLRRIASFSCPGIPKPSEDEDFLTRKRALLLHHELATRWKQDVHLYVPETFPKREETSSAVEESG